MTKRCQTTDELWTCPAPPPTSADELPSYCVDGQLYRTCEACRGNGVRDTSGDTCIVCRGSGEDPNPTTCSLCEGTGLVTPALAKLVEAERAVRRHEPQWDGDSKSRPGITQYSLAQWYRRRAVRGLITLARGRPTVPGERGANTGVFEVDLVVPDDASTEMTFYGLTWGYNGEGCAGLAIVLTDAGFFDELDEASQYVAALDPAEPWIMRVRQLA